MAPKTATVPDDRVPVPRRRGFAAMSPDRRRQIASLGGKAAHAKGNAHQWTAEEARRAGQKGGQTVSRDREHMAEIGRAGGWVRAARTEARRLQRTEGL